MSVKPGYTDAVLVNSAMQFFYSISLLGSFRSLSGVVGGQVVGFIANRYVG